MNARVLALAALLSAPAAATEPLDLLIVRDGWNADRESVRKVLESSGDELHRWFPQRDWPPLIVRPRGGPITLYERGPNGEIFVRLDTGNTYWAQYAYQFAHECCHVFSEYDRDPHGQDWFEESLCESASLFVLRRMSESWKTKPPFPNWKQFAPRLAEYAQQRIEAHPLPDGLQLGDWFRRHRRQLEESPVNRKLTGVVAVQLLPFFEARPQRWAAVGYLNRAKPKQRQEFAEFVKDWRTACPPDQRPVVEQIAAKFSLPNAPPDTRK